MVGRVECLGNPGPGGWRTSFNKRFKSEAICPHWRSDGATPLAVSAGPGDHISGARDEGQRGPRAVKLQDGSRARAHRLQSWARRGTPRYCEV